MRKLSTLATIVSSVLLFTACSTVSLDENKPPIEERTGKAPVTNGTAVPDSRTVGTVTAQSNDPINDPQGILAKRSVYFDLDSYIVKDEFRPVIEAHARYLNGNKGRRIVIQGHTDERGGSEYNLALGQKRAEAVRKSLSLLGVSDAQMEAVSFGKEKPKALGSDDTAWAENRRADIVY
jgi:peptidoglycan-associated lipoprotein